MASRRDFVRSSATALGAVGLASLARPTAASARHETPRASAPLDILILGGTGFTGPFQVRYAIERGHKVTVFNRGRRQPELPASVVHLRGDRATGDLNALRGKKWDVVIDNPTTLPRWVRDAGEVLKGATNHYVFISTISVYAATRTPPSESAALAKYGRQDDPFSHRAVTQELMQEYGAFKALSEQEAEKLYPGRVTVIRPGLIVGPEDQTDRFTYWPIRIDRGGEVMCPGTPDDPAQIIDARDLAEWTVRMVEQRAFGIYNATGPRSRLSFAEMLSGIRAVTSGSNDVKFTWVPADFLAANQVRPWVDMPVWFPPGTDEGSLAETDISAAIAKGLTFRPLAVTARDTIDWFKKLPAERQQRLRAGLAPEKEREVLAAWHAKAGR